MWRTVDSKFVHTLVLTRYLEDVIQFIFFKQYSEGSKSQVKRLQGELQLVVHLKQKQVFHQNLRKSWDWYNEEVWQEHPYKTQQKWNRSEQGAIQWWWEEWSNMQLATKYIHSPNHGLRKKEGTCACSILWDGVLMPAWLLTFRFFHTCTDSTRSQPLFPNATPMPQPWNGPTWNHDAIQSPAGGSTFLSQQRGWKTWGPYMMQDVDGRILKWYTSFNIFHI